MSRNYYLVEKNNGDTYLARSSGTLVYDLRKVGDTSDAGIQNITPLDITPHEFVALANQTKTHNLKFDSINNKVMATPKQKATK